MSANKPSGTVGLWFFLAATSSNATTGLSGGIGLANAVLLIGLACFILGGVITFVLHQKYKKKWLWVLFPAISSCFLVAVWSVQFL
jgi:hypothetical protein